MLDYHGLAGHAAAATSEVALRHQVTAATVINRVRKVHEAGARLPLDARVLDDASRASLPGEDHLGRVRIAATLGISPLPAPPPAAPVRVVPSATASGRAALRILAAAGPLTITTLTGALDRGRRFRHRRPRSVAALEAALAAAGAVRDAGGRWHAPAGTTAAERYQVIVAAGAGRELNRREMIDILIAAGYEETSATGRMSTSHPLFQHLGPNRYRVVSDTDPDKWPRRCPDHHSYAEFEQQVLSANGPHGSSGTARQEPPAVGGDGNDEAHVDDAGRDEPAAASCVRHRGSGPDGDERRRPITGHPEAEPASKA